MTVLLGVAPAGVVTASATGGVVGSTGTPGAGGAPGAQGGPGGKNTLCGWCQTHGEPPEAWQHCAAGLNRASRSSATSEYRSHR